MDHMLWMGEQAVTMGRVSNPDSVLSYIERVTVRDIQRVARHLFVTERMHVAVVGPVAEAEAPRLASLCRIS